MAEGDWLIAQELFERGDPGFVDALRQVHNAEALGSFARRWYEDRRPVARQFLLDYLDLPLNAFRHEALVKRLFKLAEGAGDDSVMARFLVAFDRSVRRERGRRHQFVQQSVPDQEAARKLEAQWRSQGLFQVSSWRDPSGKFAVYGYWTEERLVSVSNSGMPRDTQVDVWAPHPRSGKWGRIKLPEWIVRLRLVGKVYEAADLAPYRERLARFRLFSAATRHYLRRRCWRYFRHLGRRSPERYVPAIVEALVRYRDSDLGDGIALLDKWGLVHALFHHSPALEARSNGWVPAPNHSLAELEPAPMFPALWEQAPASVVELLLQSGCRPVRQWAMKVIRRDFGRYRPLLTLPILFGLLGSEDAEVVAQAAEWLKGYEGLDRIDADLWLTLLDTPDPIALDLICELIGQHVRPERLSLDQVLSLATRRPVPVARLGLAMLGTWVPRTEAECEALLRLAEAECDSVRPELLHWARTVLSESERFRPDWVLEFLDSRHADVREVGWSWFRSEPRSLEDVETWKKLLESPYDDVRLGLVSELEGRLRKSPRGWDGQGSLDPEGLRLLWATVLLNTQRGGRAKPTVVRQMIRRLRSRPDELRPLLPVLAVAVRSVRGPEWRAGLAAVVQLATSRPDAADAVRSAFPELAWEPS